MKIISQCQSCGKREKVDERMVQRDQYGSFHICDDCMDDTRQWSANLIRKAEIRWKKRKR